MRRIMNDKIRYLSGNFGKFGSQGLDKFLFINLVLLSLFFLIVISEPQNSKCQPTIQEPLH